MKKLVIYVVAIGVGVLLSFPLVTGFALERAYQSRVASMPQQPGVEITAESYDRGWFGSQALVRVRLHPAEWLGDPTLVSESFDLLVKSDLQHGPVLFTDLGVRFGLGYGNLGFAGDNPEGLAQTLSEWLAATPLTIQTIIYFDQTAHTELEIQAYSADEGEDHIRFGGLSASLLTSADLTRFDASFLIRPSSLLTTDLALDMTEASGAMNYQGNNPYTLVGESVFALPRLALNSKAFSLILEDIKLNHGSQLNQGKMDFFQTLEISRLESPLPLESARWHMEVLGVSPEGLEQWSEVSLEIQQAVSAGTLPVDAMGEAQLTPELEHRLTQVMQTLLQPGLGFVQRLDVGALGAPHHAHLNLEFVGLPAGVSWDSLEDPMQFLPAFRGALDLELDEAAVMGSQFAAMVQPYQQQGLLLTEQGKLVLRAALADGVLMLNDNPLPLEAMLQSAMAPEPGSEPGSESAAEPMGSTLTPTE
ncbi:MAG: DUF945 family protein [Pseudomonadota bacterium]|nr:DUF945 family protein [Pseudomonadota bacterium]